MIDLTPLDVRTKRGDFKKLMRGYDPQEVDVFLEMVAERLEMLTRENIGLRERSELLQQQVNSQTGREQAVQDALVTAQELRADIRGQAQREAENLLKEAETEGRRLIAEAEAEARTKLRTSERRLDQIADALQEMERRRNRFLTHFRQLLERELDVVQVEEDRKPLEEQTIDLDLGTKWGGEAAASAQVDPEATTLEIPAVDGVPPPDAPIDQLAEAYRQHAEPNTAPPAMPSALGEAMQAAPPAPKGQKHDNLMLYLDTDDEV
ncbi:MAG: DivIVA domain-containing protein [Gemmatimonadota bacterium]|nr:DivIVA domain-containing protein [Gemmatimonadota bacterium]MDH3421425.1 DivIVA domain-containing protein [Gemmatimonadota bacterium]